MDARKKAMVAAGFIGAGALAVSLAALVLGAQGAPLPVVGETYGCCCCCSSGYFVPLLGLVGVAAAVKRL